MYSLFQKKVGAGGGEAWDAQEKEKHKIWERDAQQRRGADSSVSMNLSRRLKGRNKNNRSITKYIWPRGKHYWEGLWTYGWVFEN